MLEYEVTVDSSATGQNDIKKMTEAANRMAAQGWRLAGTSHSERFSRINFVWERDKK